MSFPRSESSISRLSGPDVILKLISIVPNEEIMGQPFQLHGAIAPAAI